MREYAIPSAHLWSSMRPAALDAYSASTPAGSTFAAIGNRGKGSVVAAGGVSDRQAALAPPAAITADAAPEYAVLQFTQGYRSNPC